MLATWPAIARIDRGVLAGATMALWELVLLPAASVVVTLLTASTNNSCKNSEVLVPLPPASKPAPDPTTMATALVAVAEQPMPAPGSAAQPAVLLPGAVAMRTVTTKVEARRPVLLEAQLRGLVTEATVTAEAVVVIIGMVAVTLTTAAAATLTAGVLLRLGPLLGTRHLQRRLPTRVRMLAMAPMALRRE